MPIKERKERRTLRSDGGQEIIFVSEYSSRGGVLSGLLPRRTFLLGRGVKEPGRKEIILSI